MLLDPGERFLVELVLLRRGHDHADAQLAATDGQAAGDVVGVADPGQRVALELADQLADRVQIAQRLAGMAEIGQAVDDRAGAVLRPDRRPSDGDWRGSTTTSAYSPRTRAKSATLSRLPNPASLPRKIELPPRWAMPASKLTRVRSDGFSKIKAITRPGSSGSRRPLLALLLQILRDREDAFDFGRGYVGECQ